MNFSTEKLMGFYTSWHEHRLCRVFLRKNSLELNRYDGTFKIILAMGEAGEAKSNAIIFYFVVTPY